MCTFVCERKAAQELRIRKPTFPSCAPASSLPAMVRRRSSKSKDTKPGPRPVHKKDGKIKRWNKPSDIPVDEEDHCTSLFSLPRDLPQPATPHPQSMPLETIYCSMGTMVLKTTMTMGRRKFLL